ncbi:hypothetical protein [Anaeromyxobacter oryzae]|uniref:Uncharacterized protein n=1 Tax=Anaeromyxobacter oryzae TaxID=2918170 RepID=A0ABM7WRF5_9BACT|nr:hypothetical protein [Anaeromyxobacter oryzae]BDG02057.1 hypothetical protein AMOR_10530 [Anaeromyxobacter oryzae]
MRPDRNLREAAARLGASARAVAARLAARARAVPAVERAIQLARRRPDAVVGAALLAGVAAMILHWR